MIVGLKKAILHILDANSGLNVLSDSLLDVENAEINNFIARHIEKIYESGSLRPAEFKDTSGLKAKVVQYKNNEIDFVQFSENVAERLSDAVFSSEDPTACDVIVCEFVTNEQNIIGILKCNNKTGVTHSVVQSDGHILNNIINHHAILPPVSQKIAECAFIDMDTMEPKYTGKKYKIDGETVDIIADLLLECEFEISPRESANTVTRIAKKVALENGADTLETTARIKEYVTKSIEENDYEYVDTDKVADIVFEGLPGIKEEFVKKIEKAGVPKQVEVNPYITKKMTSNVKIVTDTGVEVSFPPEYYRDPNYIEIITNEDGTLSIKINNITEMLNR